MPRGKAPDDATLAAGEVLYTVHCATCHMADGQGEEGLGVPLVGSATVRAADPSTLINVVLYGPHLPPGLEVDRSPMKMFGKRLSDDDIAAVLSYVRDRFGDGAGAVTPEEVARQR
ncbi:MAG: hypothetical protein KatS3mg124_1749 [Porticoccaceae bacterium]|nr:MAG: hypothetical protein KatS3mg124_1749 [Porticoccaceae bacterium]